MKIAIAGSSGLIGTALGAALQATGHEVLRLVRGSSSDLAAHWDPADGWMRPGALAGCDAVINLSGASIGEGRWNDERKALLRDSRIDSTRLLVEQMAAEPDGPRRLVNASAIGFYGDRADTVLDEDAAPGAGFLAGLVVDWEREALAGATRNLQVTCARLGVVLSEDGGALARMLTPFKMGLGGRLGSGRQWFSWVSLDDAVAALAFLAVSDTDGPVNVVAPEPVRNVELTKALGRVLRRPAIVPTPRLPLRVLIGESVDELLFASQNVTSAKLERAGFRFAHRSVEAGLAAALGKEARGAAAPLQVRT